MPDLLTDVLAVFLVWAVATWLLSRRLPRAMALDLTNTGVLIWLMVISALNGEYSLRHLVG